MIQCKSIYDAASPEDGRRVQDDDAIAAFEARHRACQPWLFRDA
jgi:uncharacterized protein YeaO (DUF488 family)